MIAWTGLARQIAAFSAITLFAVFSATQNEARAINIQEVITPGGISAWLVEEKTVPLITVAFAFRGGSAHDPDGKEGLANFLSGMLDEGAGDLDSTAYQTALDRSAARLSFSAGRDTFHGTFMTLSERMDEAFGLLRLAVNEPRFDDAPVERIRRQIIQSLERQGSDPRAIAMNDWFRRVFGDHPYAWPSEGTEEGVRAIYADDLRDLHGRLFARDSLHIVVVGDVDADTLARYLDETFANLPQQSEMGEVPDARLQLSRAAEVVDFGIPQSVIQFGQKGLLRNDPEFIPAFVLNHILGGGGFGSRLVEEVREKRGLTYSIYSSLLPFDHAGLLIGGTATRNETAGETIELIRQEFVRMAESGPTTEELETAQTYLTGSYALRLDSSRNIARQLLRIQLDELGIDYVNERNKLIEAVTLEDVRSIARSLLDPDSLTFLVVGQPEGL